MAKQSKTTAQGQHQHETGSRNAVLDRCSSIIKSKKLVNNDGLMKGL